MAGVDFSQLVDDPDKATAPASVDFSALVDGQGAQDLPTNTPVLTPVTPGAAESASTKKQRLVANAKKVWNFDIPGLSDVSQAVANAAKSEEQEAGDDAEEQAKLAAESGTSSTGAVVSGVLTGAPKALESTLNEAAANFIPATPGDIATLAMMEGAGKFLGSAAGRAATGAMVGYGLGGVKGAVAGGLGAAMMPVNVRRFVAETPLTEVQQKALAAAKELNLPTYLDDLVNSPFARWMGDKLRSDPSTSAQMVAADTARAKDLLEKKLDLLTELGPGGGRESIGTDVQRQVSPQLDAQEVQRLQGYQEVRSKMTNPFPAPELPEGRGSALRGFKKEEQTRQIAQKRSLYNWAEQAAPNPDMARTSDSPLQTAVDAVHKSFGGKPVVSDPAYNMAKRLKVPDDAVKNALSSVGDLLDKLEKDSAKNMSYFNDMAKKHLRANPTEISKFEPDLQAAWANRDLGALRAAQGDLGALAARPDLMAQLPPETRAALAQKGSVSLTRLNYLITTVGDEVDKDMAAHTTMSGSGKKLLDMKHALEQMRDDYYNQLGGEAKRRLDIANSFNKKYIGTFQNERIAALFKSDPVGLLTTVARSGNEKDIKALVNAVGPQGNLIIGRHLIDLVMGDGSHIPTELEILKNLKTYGTATRTVFNPMQRRGLTNFAKTGDLPQFLQSAYEAKLRPFMDRDPDKIINSMLDGTGDELLAKAVKRYVKPETFSRIGRLIADGIMTPTAETPELGNAGIRARISGYSDGFLHQFFNQDTVRRMRLIGDASQLLPGFGDFAKVTTPDKPIMSMGRNGATISPKVLGTALIKGTIGDAAFSLKRDAIYKMYTSPDGVKMLTTLLKMSDTDPRWPSLLKRIAQGGYLQVNAELKRHNKK